MCSVARPSYTYVTIKHVANSNGGSVTILYSRGHKRDRSPLPVKSPRRQGSVHAGHQSEHNQGKDAHPLGLSLDLSAAGCRNIYAQIVTVAALLFCYPKRRKLNGSNNAITYFTNDTAVWSHCAVELADNGETGEKRIKLLRAPEVGHGIREWLYLTTNDDPIILGWLDNDGLLVRV